MIEQRNSKHQHNLKPAEAFSAEELAWFRQFERDVELWCAVDRLFPESGPQA